jgi:hypothetical protein
MLNRVRFRPAARTQNRKRLHAELMEDRTTPTVSIISANFNSFHIDAGDTIWFNSAGRVSGANVNNSTIQITDATVTFTASGSAYTVNIPDTSVTLTMLATSAYTSFSESGWQITAPPEFDGNVFLGGGSLRAPSSGGGLLGGLLGGLGLAGGLPGGITNVTWTANFTSDTPGLTVNWQWGAAVYSNFSSSPANLAIKTVDDPSIDQFHNSDRAGTPENFKQFVVAGARGQGWTNYTGNYTTSTSVVAEVPEAPALGSLSGRVYEEFDGVDGFSAGDVGTVGMELQLTGVDYLGNQVSLSVFTDADGSYSFTGLRAGTYTITRIQSGSYNDGPAHVGTINGNADGSEMQNAISNITLGDSEAGVEYNFEVYVEVN